jgi:inner membrane protein
MTAKGHMTLATTVFLAPLQFETIRELFDMNYIWFIYGFVVFGSLVPDIDEPNSYIGRRFKVVSTITSLFFKHRSMTHFLIFPLGIFCISFLTQDTVMKHILYGVSFGILLHDMGDMLTKSGIVGFFFPLFPSTRVALLPRVMRFRTGSVVESLFVGLLLAINAAFLFNLGKVL